MGLDAATSVIVTLVTDGQALAIVISMAFALAMATINIVKLLRDGKR